MLPGCHRPHNILLAIDGSKHSQSAIDLLCNIPLAADSTVTALAVLDTPHTLRRSLLTVALEDAQTRLQGRGFTVNTGLLHGHPAEALANYADEHPTDLIVLGALGLRATLGILLGGVAQGVVEYSHWPALIVRAPYRGLRRILLVTDGSEQSLRAEEFLGRFPLPPEAHLSVVHVLPPILNLEIATRYWPVGSEAFMAVDTTGIDFNALQAEEESHGHEILNASLSRLAECGLKSEAALLRGDAATEIINYAGDQDADLIVAGSRGMSAIRGWLLGSVSRKLVHYAACSVLIVK